MEYVLTILVFVAISLAIASIVFLAFELEPKDPIWFKITMAFIMNIPMITIIICFASILVYCGTINELRNM